jgi:hypothetical protein
MTPKMLEASLVFGSQLPPKCKDARFRVQPKIKSCHLKDDLAGRKKVHDSVHVVLSEKSAFHFTTFVWKAGSYPRELSPKTAQVAIRDDQSTYNADGALLITNKGPALVEENVHVRHPLSGSETFLSHANV